MGISTFVLEGPQNDRNLATALGGLTKGVTPLELTSAYGTFANKGVHVEPVAILKVLDRNGKVLEQADPKQRSVVSETSAAELTDMLQGVVAHGTGAGANIGRPAAGKTGTTSDYRDAWFVGYTPDLVAGVWVGCDDNADLDGMTGGNLPATIWRAFMGKAVEGTPVKNFDGSRGIKGDTIDEITDDNKKKDKDKDKNKKGSEDKQQVSGNGKRNEDRQSNDNKSQAPVQPAAPSPAAPGPGGGAGKGKN